MVPSKKVRAVTVLFGGRDYEIMAAAMARSMAVNSPEVRLDIIRADFEEPTTAIPRFWPTNAAKGRIWNKVVQESEDPVILLDCDLIIRKDIRKAFAEDFDIACTCRKHKFALNCGVVFMQPTPLAKSFMQEWTTRMDSLVSQWPAKKAVRLVARYAGAHQAAFASAYESLCKQDPRYVARIKSLPCAVWNCEQFSWDDYSHENTVVLHVKSELRAKLLGDPAGKIYQIPKKLVDPLVAECIKYGYEDSEIAERCARYDAQKQPADFY